MILITCGSAVSVTSLFNSNHYTTNTNHYALCNTQVMKLVVQVWNVREISETSIYVVKVNDILRQTL